MSTVEEQEALQDQETAQDIGTKLLPLLKEYRKKLRLQSKQARVLQARSSNAKLSGLKGVPASVQLEYESLQWSHLRLATPAQDLIRQASQLVQHGKLKTATRMELSLRLAEFEAALQEAQRVVNLGPNG
jgi:hypothetical protein